MKRCLIFLSFIIVLGFVGNWVITTPEYLPENDGFVHFYKRRIFNNLIGLKRDFYANNHVPLCKNKIDIVILANEQDVVTAPHAIDAAKGLVMHPINKIYLVCDESKKMRDIAIEKDAEFIDANQVLSINRQDLPQNLKREFITLNTDSFTHSNYYLVINADTLLLQTQVFLRDNKAVLFATEDYSIERKRLVESALKCGKYYNLAFTGPIMFFDKTKLNALKNHLKKLHNRPWYDILNTENFSAFEIYANFVLTTFQKEIMITCDRNVKIPTVHSEGIEWQRGFLSRTYKSLTFQYEVDHA